jgi:Flp pilus assembly pilin Flp
VNTRRIPAEQPADDAPPTRGGDSPGSALPIRARMARRRRLYEEKGDTMRNYGIIGTLVAIILIIVVLRLLGIF